MSSVHRIPNILGMGRKQQQKDALGNHILLLGVIGCRWIGYLKIVAEIFRMAAENQLNFPKEEAAINEAKKWHFTVKNTLF